MAIDFMIMPISRYIAGDFITPLMRFCWEQGTPYFVFGPDGKRELPPNVPYGGELARQNRARFVDMVRKDLQALPIHAPISLWDEHSEVEPEFQRVDPESYCVFREQLEGRSVSRLFRFGRARRTLHCASNLFLPCDFSAPFRMAEPLERLCGSAPQALEELRHMKPTPEASSAAGTLKDALEDSVALQLPMIVDE